MLPVVVYGDPGLSTPAVEVPTQRISKLKGLAQEMLRVCRAARGAGLAANQVGRSERIAVTTITGPLVWVNPKVVRRVTDDTVKGPEGCLSVPGKLVQVRRFVNVLIGYQDLDGHVHEQEVSGRLAVVLQHEIDHLDGKLITDLQENDDQVTNEQQ